MLEYGGGCPASLAAMAIKKKKQQNLQALKVGLCIRRYAQKCLCKFFFFTYKQTAVVVTCAIKRAIERAKSCSVM